jgi:hypothetical protein
MIIKIGLFIFVPFYSFLIVYMRSKDKIIPCRKRQGIRLNSLTSVHLLNARVWVHVFRAGDLTYQMDPESQLRYSTGLYTGFAFKLSHPGEKHSKNNILLKFILYSYVIDVKFGIVQVH